MGKSAAAVELGAKGGRKAWKGLSAAARAAIMKERWATRRNGKSSGKRPRKGAK